MTLLWRRLFGYGFFYGQNLGNLTGGNNAGLRSRTNNTLWDLYALSIRPFGIIFEKTKPRYIPRWASTEWVAISHCLGSVTALLRRRNCLLWVWPVRLERECGFNQGTPGVPVPFQFKGHFTSSGWQKTADFLPFAYKCSWFSTAISFHVEEQQQPLLSHELWCIIKCY